MKVIKRHHRLSKFKLSVTVYIPRKKFVAKILETVILIVKDYAEIRVEIIDPVCPATVSSTSILEDYQLLLGVAQQRKQTKPGGVFS